MPLGWENNHNVLHTESIIYIVLCLCFSVLEFSQLVEMLALTGACSIIKLCEFRKYKQESALCSLKIYIVA
jgi:hypothetical protein